MAARQPHTHTPPPVLCLVEAGSAAAADTRLEAVAASAPGVVVLTERRASERRGRKGIREEAAALIRLPVGETTFRADRRKRERRVELRAAAPPGALRALAAEHPGSVRFLRRLDGPATDAKAGELIQRVQAGDTEALDELYRLYLAPLYGYMVVTLHDHHAAEDAAHEVFVSVLRALPNYELRGVPFRVWLFRIARNHVLNVVTRARPEDPEDPAALNGDLERLGGEGGEADLGALSDDEFLGLIRILPLRQRQVLVLRYVFDMSFAEIGAVVGMNASAARMQQRRAFAALKPRLLARRRGSHLGTVLPMSSIRREPAALLSRAYAPLVAARL